MVDDISFLVVDESVSILIKGDIVYQLSHEGVIQLNAYHSHKPPVQVNRHIVRNDTRIQVISNIWMKPDMLTGGLRYSKPDQTRCVVRIILCDISHFVLFIAIAAFRSDKPKPLHIRRYFRIDSIIIRHDSIRLIKNLPEESTHAIEMSLQLLVFQSFQICFNICGNGLYVLLNIFQT